MNNFIEFKNVTKGYVIGNKTYNALNNISFTLPKGEFICILGPSGAGKSTLLNLLGGMDRPTSGDIIIDKENISKKSDKELTKYRAENVGFIFQFYNILPTLTVLENVENVKNEIEKNIENAKAIIKIEDTASYVMYQGEIDEGASYVGIFSGLFLSIASLSVITTMTRVIKKQKLQIGIMKALGIKNSKIICIILAMVSLYH